MVGFLKGISERLSNRMMAPGAEEADGYYDSYDDEEDYDDDDYDDEPEFEVRYTKQDKNSRSNARSSQASRSSSRSGQRDNVYGLPQAPLAIHKQAESVVMHPKNMEDAVEIGSHVRSGRMSIVDLTGVPTSEAQRVADYLCGISDALDGAITRVNNTIIAVSPPNHRVMPDYREESPFDAKFLKKAANDR